MDMVDLYQMDGFAAAFRELLDIRTGYIDHTVLGQDLVGDPAEFEAKAVFQSFGILPDIIHTDERV